MIPPEYSGLATLARRTRLEPEAVEILPGDVGRRRYLRLTLPGGRTVLGVVYCAEESDSRRRWVAAHGVLRERLRVPMLIADDQAGNHIVEDLGRTDLAARLLEHAPERALWLSRAAAAAAILADLPDPAINPPFDAAFFRRELDLARQAVFDLYLKDPLTSRDRAAHDAWADALSREIASHPRALCHRDYHGNNLFPIEDTVGWIDFQDLRAGPDTYDIASLLWERTTLDWMTEDLAAPVLESFARARHVDGAQFRARFQRVLLQRAWKVCGTFARAVAQGRGDAYRRYLPGEFALVGRLLGNTPEEREFRRVFEGNFARRERKP
jgi:aminoglycoside/choline kinase family phosphotransferase